MSMDKEELIKILTTVNTNAVGHYYLDMVDKILALEARGHGREIELGNGELGFIIGNLCAELEDGGGSLTQLRRMKGQLIFIPTKGE